MIYECCRWCSFYANGECEGDWYHIDAYKMVDPIKVVEDGILDGAVREMVESFPFDRLKNEIKYNLSDLKISKKKSSEFEENIDKYIENEFMPMLMNKINNHMERFLANQAEEPDYSLEIVADEHEFICKAFR